MAARTADVVVIGAGIIGAACAYFLSRAGLSVVIVDEYGVAAGTTGAGEGNVLVSDKAPGPELGDIELETKGGLVVAWTVEARAQLETFAGRQRVAGVEAESVQPEDLATHEPQLSPSLAGGVRYPQDLQVNPMLAAARLVEKAVELGAVTRFGDRVSALRSDQDGITDVEVGDDTIATRQVVNAAGLGSTAVAAMADVTLPILPRRGFIVVTEPLPQVIRHKVYTADYVANVASDSAGLETSTVVESTKSGTVLIGASRERLGLDRSTSLPVIGVLARQAIALFPFLAEVQALRTYPGFRPYCPDHLPVIGPDPRMPGLVHACGHEGAGIGLAPATGQLVTQAILGQPPTVPLGPFAPQRFEADVA